MAGWWHFRRIALDPAHLCPKWFYYYSGDGFFGNSFAGQCQKQKCLCQDIDKVNVSQWGHTAMIGNTVCALEALDPLEA